MSAKFDWNQFEAISEGKDITPAFDWSQFEEVKRESKIPAMKRELGMAGKVVGSTVLGIPGDIAAQVGKGINWLAGVVPGGKPKTEEELAPLTKSPFTSESIKSGIEKIAPSLAPITQEEKDWEENLSLLTSLVTPVPGGKAKALDRKKLQGLYQAGKRLGLTEKQLAPLFHGKITQGILGKIAGQGKDAAKQLELTQNALGSVYDTIKSKGTRSIPSNVADTLETRLQDFRSSLEKTLSASPERQAIINFLQKAEDKLAVSGATGEELINFYQDINKTINWRSLHGGKRQMAKAKNFVEEALQKTDPSLAKDFKTANKLWEKSAGVINSLGHKKFKDFINYSAAAGIAGALVTGNVDYAGKVALSLAGKQALAKVASKLLTDPKWMNLHGKLLQAIKNNSPKAAQTVIQTLKNRVREEMPEEFEDLEAAI